MKFFNKYIIYQVLIKLELIVRKFPNLRLNPPSTQNFKKNGSEVGIRVAFTVYIY